MWVGGKTEKKKSTFCFVRESEVDVPVFFCRVGFVGDPGVEENKKKFFFSQTHEPHSMSHLVSQLAPFLFLLPFHESRIIKNPFFVFLSRLIFSDPFPFDFPFIFDCGWLVEIGVWILQPPPKRGGLGHARRIEGNFFFCHFKEKTGIEGIFMHLLK